MASLGSCPPTLWLPPLPRFGAASPWRRLLARADALPAGARGYLDGLVGYFESDVKPLPAAALIREQAADDAGTATWLSADPAWIEPEMAGARLLACGQLGLELAQAEALAEPLRPVFDEAGMQLELTTPDRWHVRLPPGVPLPEFPAPEQAMGENLLVHLPQGAQAKRWRLLLNETQVLLHQHPLNAERRARGLPPVNSLWLWGGGSLPARLDSALRGVCGSDPLLLALAAQVGLPSHPRDAKTLEALPDGWLVDLQDVSIDELERVWWPAFAAWVGRRALRLHFASGERFGWHPLHRLRFWRGTGA